ncbi:MAG: hypothetical protein IJL59_08715, partial [Clostridia bacterium]|nr:hypothetical protein [Clostridia bacterium]
TRSVIRSNRIAATKQKTTDGWSFCLVVTGQRERAQRVRTVTKQSQVHGIHSALDAIERMSYQIAATIEKSLNQDFFLAFEAIFLSVYFALPSKESFSAERKFVMNSFQVSCNSIRLAFTLFL